MVSTVQPPSQEEAARYKVQATFMGMRPSLELLRKLAELLDTGAIRTEVTKTYLLSQAPDAWKNQMTGRTRGKVVLNIAE